MALIKVCPACNAENSPSVQRCESCGAMLIGVDLTEKSEATASAPVAAVAVAPAATNSAVKAPRRCPHADCAQLNPPEASRCVYCDRPLEEPLPEPAPALRAAIRWPWTEELQIGDRLLIGREAPAPAALVARLEREYSNVSRRHAELRFAKGSLWIVDLGSSNGTFVNETRIAPNQPVRLAHGATLRFAANLIAHITLRNDNS